MSVSVVVRRRFIVDLFVLLVGVVAVVGRGSW